MKSSWLFILVLITSSAFGQALDESEVVIEEENPYELRIKSGFVYKFGASNNQSDPLDDHVQFADQSMSFAFLTYSIYYEEKWGIQVSFSSDQNTDLNEFREGIYENTLRRFGDDYFVNESNRTGNPVNSERFGTITLGIGRRYQIENLILRPTLSGGIAIVRLHDAFFDLKRKGINEYRTYQIEAFPNADFKASKSFWMLGFGVEADYKLYESFYLSSQIGANITFLNHTFLETTLDQNQVIIQSERLNYSRVATSIGIGAGLSLIYKL